jgi:uncharacterized membrane protein
MLSFYRQRLGALLAPAPHLLPAGLFYALYALGVVVLAVRPVAPSGPSSGPWGRAALRGALFGLVAYGTYDLTNQATLPLWPTTLTLVDMGWGCVLTAWAATIGAIVAAWMRRPRVNAL